MTKIKVLIADDHGILRAGLNALLSSEPDIEVVGEASSSSEVLKLAEKLKPQIVLMDVSMPEVGGIEATRQLVKKNPHIKVLMLTIHEDKVLLEEALQAGASGYLLKRALKDELFIAIRTVMKGNTYIHPLMLR
jgi:two-component system, NarL family, response regulator NreC